MIKREEVESFLMQFHAKASTFGFFFLEREKNLQGILDLEIAPIDREEYIKSLTADDYCEGPKKDGYDPKGLDYFVFGKMIKGKQVYIKISISVPGKKPLCMSFHVAEHPMTHPFKKT